jgi:NitT/TauT family transport system permease protein
VRSVVGEYLGSAADVGYFIRQAESVFDINTVCALVLTGFALALDGLVTFTERRLLVWRPAESEIEPLEPAHTACAPPRHPSAYRAGPVCR